MDLSTETNSVNKTIHLTGIGLAVQAFYINLTLDSILGKEYLRLAPVGPVSINPTSVWKINGLPLSHAAGKSDVGGHNERRSRLTNNERDDDDGDETDEPEDPLEDARVRQKVHKTAGIKTNFRKDESGDQVVYRRDDDDHTRKNTARGYEPSSSSDEQGWIDDVGTPRNSNNEREVAVSREIVPIIPRRRF